MPGSVDQDWLNFWICTNQWYSYKVSNSDNEKNFVTSNEQTAQKTPAHVRPIIITASHGSRIPIFYSGSVYSGIQRKDLCT